MRKIKLILFLFLLVSLKSYSQNVLFLEGDTVITLSLPQVRKINVVFYENKSLKQQVALCDSIIFYKNQEITDYKNVISSKDDVVKFQDELITEANKVIDKQSKRLEKEKKKKKWYFTAGAISGGVVGLIPFLILL